MMASGCSAIADSIRPIATVCNPLDWGEHGRETGEKTSSHARIFAPICHICRLAIPKRTDGAD